MWPEADADRSRATSRRARWPLRLEIVALRYVNDGRPGRVVEPESSRRRELPRTAAPPRARSSSTADGARRGAGDPIARRGTSETEFVVRSRYGVGMVCAIYVVWGV